MMLTQEHTLVALRFRSHPDIQIAVEVIDRFLRVEARLQIGVGKHEFEAPGFDHFDSPNSSVHSTHQAEIGSMPSNLARCFSRPHMPKQIFFPPSGGDLPEAHRSAVWKLTLVRKVSVAEVDR
jgi:hypothetical protein